MLRAPSEHIKVSLLYTDTDSYILKLDGLSMESALYLLEPISDFSSFPKDHPLYSPLRARVPGLIKSETGCTPILECCALRAKAYHVRTANGDEDIKKCKGVKRSVVANMEIESFKECLYTLDKQFATAKSLRAKNHKMFLINETKQTVSSFDDKVFYYGCGIHSRPYGHIYNIILNNCPDCGAPHPFVE